MLDRQELTESTRYQTADGKTVEVLQVYDKLAKPALERLRGHLERFNNQPSRNQLRVLYELIKLYTDLAYGLKTGRYGFGLPTGMGKTSSIIAFAAELHHQGRDDIGFAVAASKVEALCALKRDLIESGVPASKIGLLHSYRYDEVVTHQSREANAPLPDGYASEPATDDNSSRQFMLVSHNRIRLGDAALQLFNSYLGHDRKLLIWDESLIISECIGLDFQALSADFGHLQTLIERYPLARDACRYLSNCIDLINRQQELNTEPPLILHLPKKLDSDIRRYAKSLPDDVRYERLRSFLSICQQPLRFIPASKGAIVSYQITVPDELQNVVVLDASFPIRELVKLDKTMIDAETIGTLPQLAPFSRLKKFDKVTLHQMRAAGGRHSTTRDFANEWGSDRKISNDVIDVIQSIPENEAVLVFVYKRQHSGTLDMREILLKDIRDRGIDVDAKVTIQYPNEHTGLLPRINVITWGMETSLNNFAYCKHVILAGVLQRSNQDLYSYVIGQQNNIEADADSDILKQVKNSETAHLIYQAASRGSCRTIHADSQAGSMALYVIHRDATFHPYLRSVMPGLKIKTWKGRYGETDKRGIVDEWAEKIATYLDNLSLDVEKVSSSKIKSDLSVNIKKISRRSWTTALSRAAESRPGWQKEGRSVVRVGRDFDEV
ncbi:MAG: hypothetical protein KDK04_06165 [Candidatus Competibacteraceae bacterium]|nr:hypothetical protein [Candidatus Competibacteraceae bacterium]MCB1811293.1 hypothetical protein [Candidatus Competibacteraceae bacterium]